MKIIYGRSSKPWTGKAVKKANSFRDDDDNDDDEDDCLVVSSEMEEPKTVHEALNGEQSSQWREAMESEYSSLIMNDTWDLLPPPEGKNIVGSRWVLKSVTRMVL